MELYMNLASVSLVQEENRIDVKDPGTMSGSRSSRNNIADSADSGGLGFYNPKEPVITLSLDLSPDKTSSSRPEIGRHGNGKPSRTPAALERVNGESGSGGRSRRKAGKQAKTS